MPRRRTEAHGELGSGVLSTSWCLVAIGCRAVGDGSILRYLQSISPSLWLDHEKLSLHHQGKIPAVHHFQWFLR